MDNRKMEGISPLGIKRLAQAYSGSDNNFRGEGLSEVDSLVKDFHADTVELLSLLETWGSPSADKVSIMDALDKISVKAGQLSVEITLATPVGE